MEPPYGEALLNLRHNPPGRKNKLVEEQIPTFLLASQARRFQNPC